MSNVKYQKKVLEVKAMKFFQIKSGCLKMATRKLADKNMATKTAVKMVDEKNGWWQIVEEKWKMNKWIKKTTHKKLNEKR